MKTSHKIAIAVAVIGFVWVGSGMVFSGKDKTPSPAAEKPAEEEKLVEVRVRDITALDYTDSVLVTGRTQGSRSVDLSGEISAQVVEIIKDKGLSANAGDLLAKLEIKDRAAKVAEAQGRLAQREIEYNAAKNLETKGFNSKVRLAQSAADFEEAKALLETAKAELQKTDIIAPFDGVVDDRFIDVGDFVNAGTKLFRIVDLDPLKVIGYISEHEIDNIETGKKATAKLLNGEDIQGEVSYISAQANDQTRTFMVEISLPNPDLKIKAGLTAEMVIEAKTKRAHKISPSILSLNDVGQIGVMIVDAQDSVHFKPITIIADKPDYMWIGGLPEQARVITVGQHFVVEGQKVKPVPADGEGLL